MSPCPAPAAGPQFLYLHNLARHPDTGYLLATSGENTNPAVSAHLLSAGVEEDVRDFVSRLLVRDVAQRLGDREVGHVTDILLSDWSADPDTQL